MGIRALAFDIDGTLYPEGKFYLRCIPLVLRSPILFSAYYRARKDVRRNASYEPPLERELAKRVLRYLGHPADEQEIRSMEDKLRSRFTGWWDRLFQGMKPFPWVEYSLKLLREQGYICAALSDFPVGNKLSVLGISSYFSVCFSAEETGYLKPSAAPFEKLAEKLSLAPREILYIGNSMTKDVQGALQAGLYAAWFHPRPGRKHYQIRSEAFSENRQPHIDFSSYRVFPEAVDKLLEAIAAAEN